MTADYDRAVTEHIIDLVVERGELLALIEMVPAPDYLLIENIAVLPARTVPWLISFFGCY